jgi:hypothetical protein
LKPGSARPRAFDVGDGVADAGLADVLDLRGDEADLAGAELGQVLDLGAEGADAVDQMLGAAGHELDVLALADRAVDDADQDDDAEIGVVPAVDEHRLQRRGAVALGRRDAGDDRFQHLADADAGLGGGEHRVVGGEADDVLDLLADLVGLGGGQVDLVDDGHDLMVVLDRLVHVGQRLRLDALAGVHDQQRPLARRQTSRNFIREVDVTRRIHEVQRIALPIQPHRLRLDRDPPLLLDVHVIKDLAGHLALGQPPVV